MKQTAVEWLVKQFETIVFYSEEAKEDTIEEAKEMEKQGIIDAYKDSTSQFSVDARIDYPKSALEYYNKTFKKK